MARTRKTANSELSRQALDEYLVRQAPLNKTTPRRKAFAAWAANDAAPRLKELRAEERQF